MIGIGALHGGAAIAVAELARKMTLVSYQTWMSATTEGCP